MEFIILPDTPGSENIARAILAEDSPARVIPHFSGRPWIIGRWHEDAVVWAEDGRRRVAVLGCSTATERQLLDLLRRGRTDPAAIAPALTGSFHLAITEPGRTLVQGSASSARRVFHARVDGQHVAADRPQRLAALTGAGIDEDVLPLHLLLPLPPWPLSERCLWRGVEPVPSDSYLELRPDGTTATIRWWTPPDAVVPLAQGAENVRAALVDAVAARIRPGRLSADLSGGMDSTSLCFLASAGGATLTTTRFEAADPANDDERWAALAAAELSGAQHVVLTRSGLPPNFSGLDSPGPAAEAPFPWLRARAMLEHQARRLGELGSTGHLTGHGGDELFQALPAYDHALIRKNPIRSIGQLRLNLAFRRWRVLSTVRELMDNSDYPAWLASTAESLTDDVAVSSASSTQWSRPVRLPPWTTSGTATAVRDLLRAAAAAGPEPLAPQRGQHQALESARQCAGALRQGDHLAARHGVPWHAPYLDDRVVEAALSVRFEDRAAANSYKAVLVTAMRGIVPPVILDRPTKGEFSADAHAGLRHNKRALLGLCEDMELARLGMVDAVAFRADLLGLHPGPRSLSRLHSTLAAEVWLRSVRTTARTTPVRKERDDIRLRG